MKKILFAVLAVPFLTSCYAFMRADKFVYTGTMAKRPVVMSVDSTYNTSIQVPE